MQKRKRIELSGEGGSQANVHAPYYFLKFYIDECPVGRRLKIIKTPYRIDWHDFVLVKEVNCHILTAEDAFRHDIIKPNKMCTQMPMKEPVGCFGKDPGLGLVLESALVSSLHLVQQPVVRCLGRTMSIGHTLPNLTGTMLTAAAKNVDIFGLEDEEQSADTAKLWEERLVANATVWD